MKFWIVRSTDNNLYRIGSSLKPRGDQYLDILDAPIDELTDEFEDPEWLQIEDVEISPGVFERKASVNQSLKNQILNERHIEREQHEKDIQSQKQNLKDVKKAIKKIKMENLNNAQNIRLAIIALKNAIIAIEKKLLNTEED